MVVVIEADVLLILLWWLCVKCQEVHINATHNMHLCVTYSGLILRGENFEISWILLNPRNFSHENFDILLKEL